MIEIIKPDFVFEDERGALIQLVHEGWKQINVAVSKAGFERGNHFHKFNREGFYVVEGAFTLEAKLGSKKEIYDLSKTILKTLKVDKAGRVSLGETFIGITKVNVIGANDHLILELKK